MSWEVLSVFFGGICTLAIFSFLIKENPFYRSFEHLFIGIAAGWGPVLTLREFLWPKVLVPLFGLDIITYPDGTTSGSYDSSYILYVLPLLFGALYYTIFSRRLSWLAKIAIGFSLGASAGLTLKGWFVEMVPQLLSTMKPLVVFQQIGGAFDWGKSLSNTIFVYTVFSVMIYFFFSFQNHSRLMRGVSSSGRWLMMICFGALFGSTVMARMALLVERVQFLLIDWIGVFGKFRL